MRDETNGRESDEWTDHYVSWTSKTIIINIYHHLHLQMTDIYEPTGISR